MGGSAAAGGGPGDAVVKRIAFAALALLLAFGLVRATTLAWVCDDAFISFRYADNLVSGHGLVYNAGERVEGYTNLLWTLMLAATMALGFTPEVSSKALGIAAYAALAASLTLASWRRHRARDLPFVPLAAALVLVSYDFHEWATGGLETMLFTWLATASVWLARGGPATRGTALAAGIGFALLVLTRPDGLLFAAMGGAAFALPRDATPAAGRKALLATSMLPTAVALALLVPAKLVYYGELLPTAFHSKSVVQPWIDQGLRYLGLYLLKNWFLPLAVLAAAIGRWRRRGPVTAQDRDDLCYAAAALVFLAYLSWVGGDFMFARRILPAVPLLLLALEGQLVQVASARRRGALAALCIAAAALPHSVFHGVWPPVRAGIADERRFYTEAILEKRRIQAEAMGKALRGTDARVLLEGGLCAFGYYSGLPYLAEATGLTQYSLAKAPLLARGRVGHEKKAGDEWNTANGIHLVVSHEFPPISRPPHPPFDLVYFGDLAVARIHLYSDEVMDRLRGVPDVSFVPIESVIERRREQIERAPLDRAERIFERLHRYYFRAAGPRGEPAARELRALIEAKRADGA
jgi:hypothetical protein